MPELHPLQFADFDPVNTGDRVLNNSNVVAAHNMSDHSGDLDQQSYIVGHIRSKKNTHRVRMWGWSDIKGVTGGAGRN